MKLSDFQILGDLGRGSYGDVVTARSKINQNELLKNQVVAMKVISKRMSKSIRTEIDTLNKVKGMPFLSQIIGSFQDRTDVFIIFRYEENGSLRDLLEKGIPCYAYAQSIIAEVVLAILYLLKVVHGDLKPENILLDKNFHAQVADFGLTRVIGSEQFTGIWGTPTYQSPEQLQGNEPWDERVDIFNAGIIFFEMVSGKHPFEEGAATDDDIHMKIIQLNFEMPNLPDPSATSFIRQTLCPQNQRLFGEKALKHQYIAREIGKIRSTFQWAPPMIYNGNNNDEMYFNQHSFFKMLSGIDFDGCLWGNTEPENGKEKPAEAEFPQLQDVQRNNTTMMLKAKLAKVPAADECRISKVNHSLYYVHCLCNKRLKAVFQTRGKKNRRNWTIQPFKRHFKKH